MLFFSFLATLATAQDIVLPPPGPRPQEAAPRDYSTSCSSPATVAACRSYNELVASKDSELLQLLAVRDAYVCFRENADVFNVIALNTPTAEEFKRLPSSALYQAGPGSFILYRRFKSGQDDQLLFFFGKWTKLGQTGSPSFETAGKEGPGSPYLYAGAR